MECSKTSSSWMPQIPEKGNTPNPVNLDSNQTPPRHDTPPPWWRILTPPIFNYTPVWDADGNPYDDENCCKWINNYLDEEAKHNLAT